MPGEGHARRRSSRGALLLVVAAACTRPGVAPSPAPTVDPCLIAPPAAAAADSLTIAFTARSTEGVAAPALMDAGRFVRRLTHQNLVRADCTGAIAAELATHWVADSITRRWTFTIGDHAKWPTGDPVTSRDVVAAWRSTSGLQSEENAGIRDSARAMDPRRVVVPLGEGGARALAAPELSIAMPEPNTGRVLGTGAYRAADGDDSSLVPSDESAALPRIRLVRLEPASDARDVLDRGVDLMLTDDPAVAHYAIAREGLAVYALPPQRIYAVVTPVLTASAPAPDERLQSLRASLARDVVGVPARPSSEVDWWRQDATCASQAVSARPVAPVVLRRVAHRDDDPVARALAGRLVSLAQRGDDSVAKRLVGVSISGAVAQLAAEPLSAAEFGSALREGTRAAFIVSVPARPLAGCRALADLARAMPWTADGGAGAGTPLLEAGGWAIVRQGAVGLTADWDGTPRLVFSETASPGGAR